MKKFTKQKMLLGAAALIMGATLGTTAVTFAEANVEDVAEEAAVEEAEEDEEDIEYINLSFGNGILKATVPEEDVWKEILTDDDCVTISDGVNTIIFNHYSDPAELPKLAVFDKEHEMTYEIAFTKEDVSVTLVAEIKETADFAAVKTIMDGIEIDMEKIDEEHLKKKHEIVKDKYSIVEANYDAWVKAGSGLCIRKGGSVDAEYITTEPYGTKLKVTGVVLKNGVDIGWRQITDAKGITGYCSGQFLSASEIVVEQKKEDKKEEPKKEEQKPEEQKKEEQKPAEKPEEEQKPAEKPEEEQKPEEKPEEEQKPAEQPQEEPKEEAAEEIDISKYPKKVAIFCAGDFRYVYVCSNGKYTDKAGNEYEPQKEFTTFIRTKEDKTELIYKSAESLGMDKSLWEGMEETLYFPQTIAIYTAGDLRYVYLNDKGKYNDSEGNTYNPLKNFTTFIRTSDQLTYYSAESQGINPDEWYGAAEETEEAEVEVAAEPEAEVEVAAEPEAEAEVEEEVAE